VDNRLKLSNLFPMASKTTTRIAKIFEGLKKTYPNAHCELEHRTPFQLLISTILSAQCTDKQVNIVTQDLFKKYKTAQDFASATLPEIEEQIKRIGLFRSKARNIHAASQTLVEKYNGEVPKTMAELTELAGVGRKTANVVLGDAFGIREGIVVDTHVARLSNRLGLSEQTSPEKIEQDLMKIVPQDDWTIASHLLVWHGRRRCAARHPDCPNCEIASLCNSKDKISA
jgi:endonuclease III